MVWCVTPKGAMDTMSEERDSAKARGERTIEAFKEAQETFTCVAEQVGIKDEEDVVALVKKVRSARNQIHTMQ